MHKQQTMPGFIDQGKHGYMVARMVEYIKLTGYSDIKANIPGLDPPSRIYWKNDPGDGHIPDLTGCRNGIYHIFAIETEDTISDAHTKAQWKLFASFVNESGNAFVVVVPEGYRDQAFEQITKLNVDVTDVLTVE